MTTHYELDISGKSLKRLEWMRDNWSKLLNVPVLNDRLMREELARIEAAIATHPDNQKRKSKSSPKHSEV